MRPRLAQSRRLARWTAAVITAALAVVVTRLIVGPVGAIRYLPSTAAIAVIAPFVGTAPALLATVLIAVALPLVVHAGPQPSSVELLWLALFLATATVLSIVGGSQRRARRRLALEVARSHAAVDDADRARAQIEAVLRSMSDGVAVFDEAGRVVLSNDAQERLTGHGHAGEIGRDLSYFAERFELQTLDGKPVPPSDWPAARVLRGEEVNELQLVARRRDTGQSGIYSFSGRQVRGDRLLALVVTRDVTARRRAERALRESEAQFRQLAEAMPQIVWIAAVDGTTRYLNHRFAEYTGLRDIADATVRWPDVVHPDDLERVSHEWQRCLATGDPFQIEVRIRRASDGSYRWFLNRALATRDSEGRIVRWFGTVTDIHDQKESQRRLVDALGVRDEFLSVAGHELKTPLAALLLHIQSLRRAAARDDGSPRLRERLEKAAAAGIRLERLINQLLDVSRIHAHRLELSPAPMDLVALVREVVDRQLELPATERTPIRIASPARLVGWWDRDRLDQVITNLVSNAVKYGHGRPIEVEIAEHDRHATVRVIDHGIGIAPDRQERIFDRFERAAPTREYGGFGLGLWIAREIVEASGGHIDVASAPSQGATFTITLPLRPADEAARALH